MQVRILGAQDIALLENVTPGLFDHALRPDQARAFLMSPLQAMAVATEAGDLVSFASGTVLLHPDKRPGFFVNEVGTRESHRRRGLGRAVTEALFAHVRAIGCAGIWLGTEPDNTAALALYRSLGGDEQRFVGFGWDGAFDLE
ncbi:GNAT family N-acetyltransferase [Marinovum sp.]|uniref:GNAT family N-acetyltransferase n=1 Tax=Marinovum sp. TaxID=2024839 RepID=UPI002B26E38B|nr:GNAT family N-acetyltransferase [Marinovum sp.]